MNRTTTIRYQSDSIRYPFDWNPTFALSNRSSGAKAKGECRRDVATDVGSDDSAASMIGTAARGWLGRRKAQELRKQRSAERAAAEAAKRAKGEAGVYCGICLDVLSAKPVFVSSCDHAVHADCARKWAFDCTGCGAAAYSCPMCREKQPFDKPGRSLDSCDECRSGEGGGGDNFAFDADFVDSTPEVYRDDLRRLSPDECREFQRVAREERRDARARATRTYGEGGDGGGEESGEEESGYEEEEEEEEESGDEEEEDGEEESGAKSRKRVAAARPPLAGAAAKKKKGTAAAAAAAAAEEEEEEGASAPVS